MHKINRRLLLTTLESFFILAIFCAVGEVKAQTLVSFATPSTIYDYTDVLNSTSVPGSTVVMAFTEGTTNGTLVNVNGVDFDSLTVNGGAFNPYKGSGSIGASIHMNLGPNAGLAFDSGLASTPPTTANAAYQSILDNVAYDGGANLTLNGLTTGRSYELQFWVNDSRVNSDWANREEFLTLGGVNSQELLFDATSTGVGGGVGQFVTATFIADSANANIYMTGGSVAGGSVSYQVNAFQVLDITAAVPEPSTYVMMLVGFAGLLLVHRVRRQA